MTISALCHSFILWIGDGTGLPDAILQLQAGLAILLLVRLVTERSLGSFVPFAAVVAAELGNETMYYLAYGLRIEDTLTDLGNTLFWPIVISVGAMARQDRSHG